MAFPICDIGRITLGFPTVSLVGESLTACTGVFKLMENPRHAPLADVPFSALYCPQESGALCTLRPRT
jgi:hypothetical protein